MGFFDNLESDWPILLGLVAVILVILFLTALAAWRVCKRTYMELLSGAEARRTIAEERVTVAEEKAMLADERAMILRDKIESMKPENFDSKIEDIVTRIKDVEYSRLNGIIAQLNDIKIGESYALRDVSPENVEPTPDVSYVVSDDDLGAVHEDIVESHVEKINELEKEAQEAKEDLRNDTEEILVHTDPDDAEPQSS